MKLIAKICSDNHVVGWLFTIAMSIAPALGFLGYRINEPQSVGWVDAETEAALKAQQETFQFGEQIVVVMRCDDFFQPERIRAIYDTIAELKEDSEVLRVRWMGDVPEVTLLRGRQLPILPPPDQDFTREELVAAREILRQHPLVQNSLLSADAQTALILIEVGDDAPVDPVSSLVKKRLMPSGIDVQVTGAKALYALHDRQLEHDHLRIQLTAYILVSLLAIVIFRRPIAILIATTGPVVGVVWTYGWLFLIGHAENELAKIILPVLIMMIGFADGMHLVIRMRSLRAGGVSNRDSVYDAIVHVGPACLLTSITTSVGFGSLMISRSEMIAGFGFASAMGVIFTFFSVIVVTPLLANSWIGQRMHVTADQDLVGRLMQKSLPVVEFACRHARAVTFTGILITVGCLYASLHLVPGDRISDRVPESSEEYQAMKLCDQKLGGIRNLRIQLGYSDNVSKAELWDVIRTCETMLESEELVSKATSIRTMLTVFKGQNRQDSFVLASRLPPELSENYYRPDLNAAQVVGRVQDAGYQAFRPVFERLDQALLDLKQKHPEFELRLLSDVQVEGEIVHQVIVELLRSLALAAIIIFVTLAVAFRSARIGIVSILPNIMPLAAAGALRLTIDESLGIASALSFAICLGIAVDDTIHYLNHFLQERRNGATPLEANRGTYLSVGSALVMTTAVTIAGLGSVMTSSMPPHVSFAAMGCTTLIAAVFADLIVLPAVMTLFPGPGATEDVIEEDAEPVTEASSSVTVRPQLKIAEVEADRT